jgi:hypothetical protein
VTCNMFLFTTTGSFFFKRLKAYFERAGCGRPSNAVFRIAAGPML